MKNNTAYLKNIHWVTLLAAAYGLISIYLAPLIYEWFQGENSNYGSIILSVFYLGVPYASIGIVTSRWKELLLSFLIAEALFIMFLFVPVSLISHKPLIYLFLVPIPLTIFICQLIGWDKRIIIVYLGVFLAGLAMSVNSFDSGPLSRLVRAISSGHTIWKDLLMLLIFIATRVLYVIIICELLNYLRSDTKKLNPLLLNLGNEYGKLNSFIAFWSMKTSLLVIALGTASYLRIIMDVSSDRFRGFNGSNEGWGTYLMTVGILNTVGSILLTLFAAWYIRRLLLEYFITYDIRSKFLYWLAVVPFIGFLSFLFMETNQVKQQNYNQKVESMGNFAASSTTAISVIAFILLFIRLVARASNAETAVVLSVVLASLLFTWMIYSHVAYYINAIVIFLALAAIIAYTLITRYAPEQMLMNFAMLILVLAQLIMSLPVYHFDKFSYTPAENPDQESAEPRDIFA